MRIKGIIIAVLVVIVLAGGIFVLTKNNGEKKNSYTDKVESSDGEATKDAPSNTPEPNTPGSLNLITYTDDGFSGESIKVKTGGTINITNKSSKALEFNSNRHPQHTENAELNVGSIPAGQSKMITVTKSGTFGYHNHLNPSQTGSITVQ